MIDPVPTPDTAQNNVLITRDGHACLGEFGIVGASHRPELYAYELGTLRFMAPECFLWVSSPRISRPSKESDVYSFAMTSFSVGSSVVSRPTT